MRRSFAAASTPNLKPPANLRELERAERNDRDGRELVRDPSVVVGEPGFKGTRSDSEDLWPKAAQILADFRPCPNRAFRSQSCLPQSRLRKICR